MKKFQYILCLIIPPLLFAGCTQSLQLGMSNAVGKSWQPTSSSTCSGSSYDKAEDVINPVFIVSPVVKQYIPAQQIGLMITAQPARGGDTISVKNTSNHVFAMNKSMNLALKTSQGWEVIRNGGTACGGPMGITDFMPQLENSGAIDQYFMPEQVSECMNGQTITQKLPKGCYLIYFPIGENTDHFSDVGQEIHF